MIGKILKLNSKDYVLRFGFKAFAKYEALTGKKMAELNADEMSMEEIPKLIWAGLTNNENLTYEQVLDLIEESEYSFNELNDIFNKAMLLSTTGKETADDERKN